MAGEWKTVALGDVARTRNGAGIKQDFFSPNGVPLARVSDFTNWSIDMTACVRVEACHAKNWESHRLNEGDVVIATVGSWPPNWSSVVGKAVRVPRAAAGAIQNQNTCCVFARPGITDQRFLFYLLRSEGFAHHAANAAAGSANQARLPVANLARFTFALPPLPEQRAIAHILGTLDDKIELNRRMNETLEAMARALFKSWFVDFDPVRAKAEGRDPGLSKPLADLFPDRLVDSELGEIPQGWEVGRFGEVVEQLRDQESPLSFPDRLFQHFSIPAFDEGQTAKSEYGESIKSLKSRVPPGVILISKLNPEIERVWLVDVRPDDRAVCSTEFLVLRSRPPFTRGYVYCLARSPLFRQQIEGLVTGTSKSHQRAQVESILNLAAVKPLARVVATFDRSADGMLGRTLECRREGRTLAALRDALLPKLISGELQVKNAKRFVAEVAA